MIEAKVLSANYETEMSMKIQELLNEGYFVDTFNTTQRGSGYAHYSALLIKGE